MSISSAAYREDGGRATAGRSRSPFFICVAVDEVAALIFLGLFSEPVVGEVEQADQTIPLYIGTQPARDPGSVIIGAAGDIACPPGRRRTTRKACGMEGTAKVLEAIRPDAVLTLGDHQYPSGSLADFETILGEHLQVLAITCRCRGTS